jgi:hypothetical protein
VTVEQESNASKCFLELIRGESAYTIIRGRITSNCAMIRGFGVLLLIAAAWSLVAGVLASGTPVVGAATSRAGAASVVARESLQDLPALPMPGGDASGAMTAVSPAYRNASDCDDEGEARYMLIRVKDRIREGKRREAIELMREIVAQYPRTSSGQRAAAQLQKHGLG